MKASINGEMHDLPSELSVGALLEMLGAPRTGIAVAKNERVVRRADYESQYVSDGDRIEIYRPLMLDPMEARRRRARSVDDRQ